MKKIFLLLLVVLLCVTAGCSNKEVGNQQNAEIPNKGVIAENKEILKANPVKGVSIEITGFDYEDMKGDRTQDNYADDNGEYFAIGSDIVKVDDYKNLTVYITVKNDTDKAISFSSAGWRCKLPDGYKIRGIDGDLKFQVASHNKKEIMLNAPIERNLNAKEIILNYNYLDYNEEWSEDIWKARMGEMTEKEYTNKYKPVTLEFKLKLN